MKKKIILYSFLLFFIGLFFGTQGIHSKPLSEEEQLLWVATGAFKDGFYDIAEKQFISFINNYPKHEKIFDLHFLLGRTLFMRGKFKEAKTIFSNILHEGKQFENMDYTLLGMAEVKRILLSLIKRFPKFDQIDFAYYLLGLLELGSNQFAASESTFKKVSQSPKNNGLIHSSFFWMGVLSFKQKQYETAAIYFSTLLENPKLIPFVYLKYVLFWLGEAQLKLGRFQEAYSTYKKFYEQFKQDSITPEAYWRIGFCEYQIGDIKSSIATFQSFKNQFKYSPLFLRTHFLIGTLMLMNGDHHASIKELNSILHPSQETLWGGTSLLALYWNYIQLGDTDGANRIYQRLQKSNHFDDEKTFLQWLNAEMFFTKGEIMDSLPYYFNLLNTKFREKALFQIGRGNFYENKFREAITNLDILLLEFPNSQYLEEGLFMKGECLVQFGNLDQAIETYQLILQQNKNNVWTLFALTQLGTIYVFRNDSEQAEKVFKSVVEAFPHHPLFYHASLQLGNLNYRQKNMVEAIHHYSMVLKGNLLELLGQAYFGLGEIFYQQGKYEKALHSFESALPHLKEASSGFFLTYLEIGNLKRRWGKYEEAQKAYWIVLDQSKDEEMRKAARELLNRIEFP